MGRVGPKAQGARGGASPLTRTLMGLGPMGMEVGDGELEKDSSAPPKLNWGGELELRPADQGTEGGGELESNSNSPSQTELG